MPCETLTRCNACKHIFSSLCSLHSHLSKGVSHPEFLYSVYLSYNGLLIARPANGTCPDKYKYESTEPPEQNVMLAEKPSAYFKNDACSDTNRDENAPTKPPEQSGLLTVEMIGKEVHIPHTDIHGKEKETVQIPDPNVKPMTQFIDYPVRIANTDIDRDTYEAAKHLKQIVEHARKTDESKLKIVNRDIPKEDILSVKIQVQNLEQVTSEHPVVIAGTEIHKLKTEPVKGSEHNLEQTRKITETPEKIACSEIQTLTRRQKQNEATFQRPVAILPKTLLPKIVPVEECTSRSNLNGPQVRICRLGFQSKIVKDNEITGNHIAECSTQKAEQVTINVSSPYLYTSLPTVPQKHIQPVDFGRKEGTLKCNAGTDIQSTFSSAGGKIPPSMQSVITLVTGSCVAEREKELSKKRAETISENRNTKCNVTPVLLIGNQHCTKVNNTAIGLDQLHPKIQVGINEANMYDDRFDEIGSATEAHKESNQESGTSFSWRCPDQYMQANVNAEGDPMSDKLVCPETYLAHNEHNYSKNISFNGVQSDQNQGEWQVVYNKEYFDQVPNNENSVSKGLDIDNPKFGFGTERVDEDNSANEQTDTSSEINEPNADDNRTKSVEEIPTKDKKGYSRKPSSRNRESIREVEVKIPCRSKQKVVFSKYGFKITHGRTLFIECNFCSKKCSRTGIVSHSQSVHHKHPEYSSKFQNRLKLLSRYMKLNWTPGSRFVKIKLLKGNNYRFCGFSMKPFPELRLMCNACKGYFCRRNLIKHVTDCYEGHGINLTDELSQQLELLKKNIPAVIDKPKLEKVAPIIDYEGSTKSKSTRSMFREFKDIKPELFRNNMPRFLKEFQEYERMRQREILDDKRKKGNELISCTVCSKKVRNSYMKTHMRYYHTSQSYPCEVCGGIYPSENVLNNHLRSVHGEKGQFPCPQCGKTYKSWNSMLTHSSVVHRRHNRVQCPVCRKEFRNKVLLERHGLTHKDDRPFSCHACNATFKRDDHLKVHINTVHDLKVLWVCPVSGCEKRYKYKVQLDTHIQKHTGKRFTCSHCPKQFTALSLLNSHRETRHSLREKLKMEDAATMKIDAEEVEYGFDGLTQLKTISISGDVKHTTISEVRWTDSENQIFWKVMDKYVEGKRSAPMTALKKVKKELKATKTLKQIRSKYEAARYKAKQKDNLSRNKRKNETEEDIHIPARKGLRKRRLRDETTDDQESECELNSNMEHKLDDSSPFEDKQIKSEDPFSQKETIEKKVSKKRCKKNTSHSKTYSERVELCGLRKAGLKQTDNIVVCDSLDDDNMNENMNLEKSESLKNDDISNEFIANLPVPNHGGILSLGDDEAQSTEANDFEDSDLLDSSVIENVAESDMSYEHPNTSKENMLSDSANANIETSCDKEELLTENSKQHNSDQHAWNNSGKEHIEALEGGDTRSANLKPNIEAWMMSSRFDESKGTHTHFCCLCDKEYPTKKTLITHMEVHLRLYPYCCDRCDKGFKRKVSLEDHINCIHLGLKLHKCNPCGIEFGSRESLNRHVSRHHRGQTDKLIKSKTWTFG